jgi:hypothetical protein
MRRVRYGAGDRWQLPFCGELSFQPLDKLWREEVLNGVGISIDVVRCDIGTRYQKQLPQAMRAN